MTVSYVKNGKEKYLKLNSNIAMLSSHHNYGVITVAVSENISLMLSHQSTN